MIVPNLVFIILRESATKIIFFFIRLKSPIAALIIDVCRNNIHPKKSIYGGL